MTEDAGAWLVTDRLFETADRDPDRTLIIDPQFGRYTYCDVAGQVDLAYQIALTRPPTEAEAEIGGQLVTERSLVDLTHVIFNLSEFLYLR